MLRNRVLSFAAALALIGSTAGAMPYSSEMQAYRSFITGGAYVDSELKAVTKSLATLDKESTTLSKDLFNASKVDNWIEKAFDPSANEVTQLRDAIDDMTSQMLISHLQASGVIATSGLSVKAQAKKLLPTIKAIARHSMESARESPKYSKLAKFAGQGAKNSEKIIAKYGE